MAENEIRITSLPTATKLEDDDKFVIDNTRTQSGTSDTTAGTREISKDTVLETILETINDDISEKYYPELYSGGLATDKGITETVPYNYRASASIGNRCFDKLVGATIAWNQIVQNGNFASKSNWVSSSATLSVANNEATITLTGSSWNNDIKQATSFLANHIYLVALDDKMSSGLSSNALTLQLLYSGESSYTSIGDDIEYSNTYKRDSLIIKPSSNATYFRISLKRSGSSSSGESFNIKNVNIFDITQMFGSTIADAIYTMEQSTSGSGVAWFRKYFPNTYYAYDSGSLQSVNVASKKCVGKNLFDGTHFTQGYSINPNSPYNTYPTANWSLTDYIEIIGGATYTATVDDNVTTNSTYVFYDADKNPIVGGSGRVITAPQNAKYIRFDYKRNK